MKKIMSFAILAFLMGGLVFNAAAQDTKAVKSSKKSSQSSMKFQKKAKMEKADKPGTVNYEQTLKDYEQAVELCLTQYNIIQKGAPKANSKNDASYKKAEQQYKHACAQIDSSIANAEKLKNVLEDARNKSLLDRTQVDRLNKANKKFLGLYAKD